MLVFTLLMLCWHSHC